MGEHSAGPCGGGLRFRRCNEAQARQYGRDRRGGRPGQRPEYREPMDTLTPEARSERMSRVRGKDTGPELVVRRLLHAMGYRYRLHCRDLPGRPDLCFPSRRKVIFVHGCFWHRHDENLCNLTRLPKSRLDFWRPKLEANRLRDTDRQAALRDLGWSILVVWECELSHKEHLRNIFATFLGVRGNAGDRTLRGRGRPRDRG